MTDYEFLDLFLARFDWAHTSSTEASRICNAATNLQKEHETATAGSTSGSRTLYGGRKWIGLANDDYRDVLTAAWRSVKKN